MATEPWQAVWVTYRPHGLALNSSELRGSHSGQWRDRLAPAEVTCEIKSSSALITDGMFRQEPPMSDSCSLWCSQALWEQPCVQEQRVLSPAGAQGSRSAAHPVQKYPGGWRVNLLEQGSPSHSLCDTPALSPHGKGDVPGTAAHPQVSITSKQHA